MEVVAIKKILAPNLLNTSASNRNCVRSFSWCATTLATLTYIPINKCSIIWKPYDVVTWIATRTLVRLDALPKAEYIACVLLASVYIPPNNRRPRPRIVHICVGLYLFAKNFGKLHVEDQRICGKFSELSINCIFIFIKGTSFHDHRIRQCAYQSTVLKALLLCIKSIF